MSSSQKTHEERLKLMAATLANLAIAIVATMILAPMATVLLSPDLNTSVQAAVTLVGVGACFVVGYLCYRARLCLGGLDKEP